MVVLRDFRELGQLSAPLALAIGVFDGIHPGHLAVIQSARGMAERVGGTLVVMTFDPHPLKILRQRQPPRLTSLKHRLLLLRKSGVPCTLVQPFDEDFSVLPAEEFIFNLVEQGPRLSSITVGRGWGFGHGRRGNVEMLQKMGGLYDFQVNAVEPVCYQGEIISSSLIRQTLEKGDLAGGARLLGRDYSVYGEVVHGDKRGRIIGFPTANLLLDDELMPPSGVYAVRVSIYDEEGWEVEETLPGVANIGVRPTVNGSNFERRLEAHLLQGGRDLYGRHLEVTFIAHLRDEHKFPGIEALKQQITLDVRLAATLLGV